MPRAARSRRHALIPLALVLVLTPLLTVVRAQPAAAAGVVNACTEAALRAALAGGGLVTFSCSGTITLAGQLELTQDTIIDGGGVVTLDGQGATRLIQVTAGVDVELRGLTLVGGSVDGSEGGGAIVNLGNLTITASALSGNTAEQSGGAILNVGTLTVSASTLSGNDGGETGGAIANFLTGITTINASTLSDNRADFGGVIFASSPSTVTFTATTLSGNSAISNGGAIYNPAGGLTIAAGTLSGNSANFGGAISNRDPAGVTLVASTLAGNTASFEGGALYSTGGPVTATASIFSGDNLCANIPPASNGYNVASDATCNLAAVGDLQNANPLLGPLMHNGGPTETLMPLTGSPVLDRVPNVLCATLSAATHGKDQRGAPRRESAGLVCDSGAVEVQVNNFLCVGERSGALRYVSIPNGCVRDEFRLLPTAEGVYAFCVGDRSGSMRYLSSGGANCLRGETKLRLPRVEPITICVGERSRAVRYVADAGQCNPRGELPYVVVNPAG